MGCEICGKEGKLVKAKIEGAVLEVCESCAETGEIIDEPKPVKKKVKEKSSKKKPEAEKQELVRNYQNLVKEAREERELSIEELAESINEKESVLKRVEQGRLNPSKKLAKKLKNKLGVSLYEEIKVEDYKSSKDKETKEMTVGDIAEVKKKS